MNRENFIFLLKYENHDEKDQVSELNTILNAMGVSFEISKTSNDSIDYLSVSVNFDILNKKMKRNAGRKVDRNKSRNYKICPTIGEVIEWKKTMTHQQIIDKIGCPRATYFRQWKLLKEMYGNDSGDFDDVVMKWEFW